MIDHVPEYVVPILSLAVLVGCAAFWSGVLVMSDHIGWTGRYSQAYNLRAIRSFGWRNACFHPTVLVSAPLLLLGPVVAVMRGSVYPSIVVVCFAVFMATLMLRAGRLSFAMENGLPLTGILAYTAAEHGLAFVFFIVICFVFGYFPFGELLFYEWPVKVFGLEFGADGWRLRLLGAAIFVVALINAIRLFVVCYVFNFRTAAVWWGTDAVILFAIGWTARRMDDVGENWDILLWSLPSALMAAALQDIVSYGSYRPEFHD